MANETAQNTATPTTADKKSPESRLFLKGQNKEEKGISIGGLYLRKGPKGFFLSSTTFKEAVTIPAGSQITIDLSKVVGE